MSPTAQTEAADQGSAQSQPCTDAGTHIPRSPATWETPELEQLAASAQEGYQNPIAQVAFRAGFIFCREYMARFVEQGGDAATAQSIRANWLPQFGDDPGGPRKYDFAEVAQAEDMENGPWVTINPGPSVDAAVYALTVMAALGMSERLSPCAPENGGWLGPDLAAKAEALAKADTSEASPVPGRDR